LFISGTNCIFNLIVCWLVSSTTHCTWKMYTFEANSTQLIKYTIRTTNEQETWFSLLPTIVKLNCLSCTFSLSNDLRLFTKPWKNAYSKQTPHNFSIRSEYELLFFLHNTTQKIKYWATRFHWKPDVLREVRQSFYNTAMNGFD
jgi:hypothetical protein